MQRGQALDEGLLSLVQDDDAPNFEGHHAIDITHENVQDCVSGYRSGGLGAKKGSKPAQKRGLKRTKEKSEIYQISYDIGHRDLLAKKEGRNLDTDQMSIKVRDCALGFDAGRKRALNKMPPRKYFEDKSPSYILGHDVGYLFKSEKIIAEFNSGKLKRERSDEQVEVEERKVVEPPAKKPRLVVTIPATPALIIVQQNDVVFEVTIENVEDCIKGYLAGKKGLKQKSNPTVKRGSKRNQEKSKAYQISYDFGRLDQLAKMEQQEFDTDPMAVKIRDCVLGFEAARSVARKEKPHPGVFPRKSPSYIAGYDFGYSLVLNKMLDDYNAELERKRLEDRMVVVQETEEVIAEGTISERVTDLSLPEPKYPEDQMALPIKKRRFVNPPPGLLLAGSLFRPLRESQQTPISALLEHGELPVPGRD